jgi:hypothetical protein
MLNSIISSIAARKRILGYVGIGALGLWEIKRRSSSQPEVPLRKVKSFSHERDRCDVIIRGKTSNRYGVTTEDFLSSVCERMQLLSKTAKLSRNIFLGLPTLKAV